MKSNEAVYAKGARVSLIAPASNHMDEFLIKATASKELHVDWTQPPHNKKDFLTYLERLTKDNQFGAFIKLNKTNELIGVININEIVKGAFKSGYLGYYIFSGFEKQGLMAEALGLLINYAFDSMQLHRLEANIQPGNINSLLLIQKCGFVKEGFSKKYLQINDQWQDHVRYAITQEMLISSKRDPRLSISQLAQEDIEDLVKQLNSAKLKKPITLFNEYLEEQTKKERLVWLAKYNDEYVGYITLVWNSRYNPFFDKNIPEIKDLNVVREYQKRGIGTALLLTAEKEAFKRSPTVGLGVGLYEDYGNAQRLYFNLGYCPDGNGITYNYEKILPGCTASVDDDLCLWLVKSISGEERHGS